MFDSALPYETRKISSPWVETAVGTTFANNNPFAPSCYSDHTDDDAADDGAGEIRYGWTDLLQERWISLLFSGADP